MGDVNKNNRRAGPIRHGCVEGSDIAALRKCCNTQSYFPRDVDEIYGGDITHCLNNTEIDRLITAPSSDQSTLVPSALFFRWRLGDISDDHVRASINAAVDARSSGDVAIVAHFRHHWLVLRFSVSPYSSDDVFCDGRALRVYDSAPSPCVARDLERIARHFGWPVPVFVPCPRQLHGSSECGLFAALNANIINAYNDAKVEPIPNSTDPISMHELRHLLISAPSLESVRENFTELGLSLYHAPAILPSIPVTSGGNPPSRIQCSAYVQSKRSGRQCADPAVSHASSGPPLCRFHLLLAHVESQPCAAISRTNRPCTHKRVAGLETCPFHTDDTGFSRFLAGLTPVIPEAPAAPIVDSAPAPPVSTSAEVPSDQLDRLFTTLDDPDLEDELLDTVALQQLPHVRSSLAALEVDWSPPTASFHPTTVLTRNDDKLTLGRLLQQLSAPVSRQAHPLAVAHIAQALGGYLRCLRNLAKPDAAPLRDSPLVSAVLELFSRRRRARKWRWTTLLRNLCEFQGALRNVPLTHGLPAIVLAEDPEWMAALKHATSQARSEQKWKEKHAQSSTEYGAYGELLFIREWACTARNPYRMLPTQCG